ncbi:hypothetical protein DL96DRAFT_448520 [Flagelloscypha sp. PMI_526]|nr:hypothetical protein DL96DRAFT_448520 [Flagelloscypha sp. PMI_526]
MPPPAYDAFKDLAPAMYDGGLAAIVDTVRGAVRMKRAAAIARNQSSGNPADEDDSDSDEDEDIFSTDFTLDLLGQVKDVLIVSLAQRWQIFDYTSSFIPEPTRSRPSRSKSPRSSTLNVVGRRTRSISPAPRAPSSGNLLLRCINVLNSICLEDCRYKISHPRPSRPPFSLQALALDVALYLIHSSRTQPTIVTKVALAMLPALSTFPPPMYQRLLAFFDNIFRIVLEDLRELRTSQASQSQPGLNGYEDKSSSFEQPGDFSVSIQIEEVGDTPATIPFKPWSLPEDPKIVSTNTPGLHMSLYNLASLCKPFLSVLLHVIDVTPQSSIEERTLAYIFRILRFCMEAKFDLHSDLLEVVAYGSSCARLGAISILRSVWPLATGHTIASRPWLLSKYSQLPGHPCRHEFVPWNFGNNTECGVCTSGIIGFGLLCPFCNLFSLHFGCFDDPEGTKVFEYSDEHVERVATLHFSLLESRPTLLQRDGHIFSAVHFFSLTLCHWCRYPIWGVFSQGLQCQSCWQAMHHDCAKHGSQACTPCGTPPSPDDLTISLECSPGVIHHVLPRYFVPYPG